MRFLLLLSLLLGCGGNSATEKFPTDIDKDATLDAIGNAAFSKLCSTFEDWLLDQYSGSHLVQLACAAEAIRSNTDAEACGAQLDDCINNPPAEITNLVDQILAQGGCTAAGVSSTGCLATVREFQGCLEALETEIREIKYTLTCAAAGEDLGSDWWMISTPAECADLQLACP